LLKDERQETLLPSETTSPRGAPKRKPPRNWVLADWFRLQALERGLILKHRLGDKEAAEDIKADLRAAASLIATYGGDDAGTQEIALRAKRYLDALATGEITHGSPSVRGLGKAWGYQCVANPDAPPRAASGGSSVVNRELA
jgi:hypothetical protein